MSNYGNNLFYGFITTSPRKGFLLASPWLLFRFIFKPVKTDAEGRAQLAPHGLRRIESALVESCTASPEQVVVSTPKALGSVIGEETAVIGIEAIDPLGKGPASTTLAGPYGLIHEEPCTAWQFRELVTCEAIQKARRRGAKIVVGGPGAWQLTTADMVKYGIDIVVDGEGEVVAPRVIGKLLNGENVETPSIIKTKYDEMPDVEEIPPLRGATVGGVVEVSRGCGRGCRFCSPTLRRLRHRGIEDIARDVETNVKCGQGNICLHAEDILRYGSFTYAVDHDKVMKLIQTTVKVPGLRSLGPSHLALASVATSRKTMAMASDTVLFRLNQDWIAYETGIETGSPRLIEKHMEKKPYPYTPRQWPEAVEQAFLVSADHNWIPCATLIVNLPGETEEDVLRTVELIERLKPYRSFIVPLLFVPFQDNPGYKIMRFTEDAERCHLQLYETLWKHDMRWIGSLADDYNKGSHMATRLFMKMFLAFIKTYANRQVTKYFNEKLNLPVITTRQTAKMEQLVSLRRS